MRAIWMAWRTEARSRWRSWVGLGLILGLTAGGAIATAGGARRTMTAYDRFLKATNAADLTTGGAGGRIDAQEAFAAIEDFPEVAQSARALVIAFRVRFPHDGRSTTLTVPEVVVGTEPPPVPGRLRIGVDINRIKIVKGRLPRPGRDDEAAIGFILADRYGLGPGDSIVVTLGNPYGEPQRDVPMRIVGVTAIAGEFQGVGTLTIPSVLVPYTFPSRYPDLMPDPSDSDANLMALRLRNGDEDYPAFLARLKETPFGTMDLNRTGDHSIGVVRTINIHSLVLLAATILLGLTALAIFGQNISRQISLGSADHPTLRALGTTRRGLALLGLARAVVPTLTGIATAVGVAFAASPLFPLGVARTAEPDPGIAFDGYAIVPGVVLLLLFTSLVALWPAIREARVASRVAEVGSARPSVAAAAAEKLSAPAPILAGLRLALEPGKGRTAVPVRSTIGGIAIAIAAITGAVVLASSLDHLLAHPELAGQTYDAIVVPFEEKELSYDEVLALPFVERVGDGTVINAGIGNRNLLGIVFAENQPIAFSVIDGRAPRDGLNEGLSEIALGVKTMERLGVDVGGVATVVLEHHDDEENPVDLPVRGRVVGRLAIPSFPFGINPQGEGFAMSMGALQRFIPEAGGCCFALFKKGTDRQSAIDVAAAKGLGVNLSNARSDLNTISQLGDAPLLLSGFFGVIGVAVLAHTLVTAIRRRRRDLAVLKTLGFMRSQARRAVAVQASTIALLAIAVGIPIGLILGRWGWRFFALSFGVQPVSIAPAWFLITFIPAVLLFANLVAVFPARAAAGTKPALILRAE